MTDLTPAAMPTVPLIVHDGEVFATSRIVAEYFDKNHQHVLEKIRKLDCSEAFNASNFRRVDYIDGKGEARPMYELTRDGFMFLAMGFTGPRAAAVKEAFIAQFNQMESMLRGGAALPAMAQSLTAIQTVVQALAERQAKTDAKVDALLTLVDVYGKYTALLEANQKPKRKVPRPVTPEVEDEIRALLAQGMGAVDVAANLNVSRSTVYNIKAGRWHSRQLAVRTQEGGAA